MTHRVAIRRAEAADAAGVAALLEELGYPASEADARKRLERLADSEDDTVLVAEDGEIVGLVSLHRVPRLAEGGSFCRITSFVVAEAQRGTGVGHRLMAAAEDVARGWGCDLLEVSSGRRPERESAHHFYRACGFEDTSGRSVRYWKRLDEV